MRRVACFVVIVIGLSSFAAADVNYALEKWLRPLQGNASVEHHNRSSSHRLPGHLRGDHHPALELFLESAVQKYGTGSVEKIIAGARSLVNDNNDALSTKVLYIETLLQDLPGDVWPLVRRTIVASLALRFERSGPFPRGADGESIQRLLLQLFAQHKQSARQKGVVEFAHVSKSGGTTFCQLARGNGCRSESFAPHTNCLIAKFKDEPRYLDGDFHRMVRGKTKTKCDQGFKTMRPRTEISCAERRRWLQRQGYTMYANEYTAFGGRADPGKAHPCRNMLTVLEVRHPHDRVISHIRHVWHAYRVHCGEDDRRLYFTGPGGHDTARWSGLMPAPTNNYLIRSLLGQAVFNLPSGGVTRAHLDLARILLAEQYDVVLVLEDHGLLKQALRCGLGWPVTERHANPAHSDPEEGLPGDLEALWALNDLDVELYHFAGVMARLDAIVYEVAEAEGSGAATAAAADGEGAAATGLLRTDGESSSSGGGGGHAGGDAAEGGSSSSSDSGAAAGSSEPGSPGGAGDGAEAEPVDVPWRHRWLLGQWLLLPVRDTPGSEAAAAAAAASVGGSGERAYGRAAATGTRTRRRRAAAVEPSAPGSPAGEGDGDRLATCGWVGASR